MNLPKYPVEADDEHFLYEFFSEGARGSIKKTVIYSQIEGTLFNLAFGDWNEELNKLDDSIRNNNGDRDKILATVAARTRLYQMGISENLTEICEDFEIQGYIEKGWEPFQKGVNYEAFLIKRK